MTGRSAASATGTTAVRTSMRAVFPATCPSCHATRVDRAWTDPISRRLYTAVVEHRTAECAVYREITRRHGDAVAHVLAFNVEPREVGR